MFWAAREGGLEKDALAPTLHALKPLSSWKLGFFSPEEEGDEKEKEERDKEEEEKEEKEEKEGRERKIRRHHAKEEEVCAKGRPQITQRLTTNPQASSPESEVADHDPWVSGFSHLVPPWAPQPRVHLSGPSCINFQPSQEATCSSVFPSPVLTQTCSNEAFSLRKSFIMTPACLQWT